MIEGDYIKTPNFHITMGKLCVDSRATTFTFWQKKE